MTLRCPIKEVPLRSWRLNQITSFGQCGEILTFECCPQCSDASGNCRASIHILKENPVTFLNVMERAIRGCQANTEIHYERSMLGDIYHCRHDCGRARGSISPVKIATNIPATVDVHSDMAYLRAIESSDSGLPGTPQTDETLSIASGIPSPTSNNKYNQVCSKLCPIKSRDRSISDTQVLLNDSANRLQNRQSDDSYMEFEDKVIRPMYAKISPNVDPNSARNEAGIPGKGTVNYASVELVSPERAPFHCKQTKLSKEDPLYDQLSSELRLATAPNHPRTRLGSSCGTRDMHPKGTYFPPPRSTVDTGDDDSEGDYFDIGPPPIPAHKKPLKGQTREQPLADPASSGNVTPVLRGRLHSSSDILERGSTSQGDATRDDQRHMLHSRVNSTELLHDRELKGDSDLLARLHEEERKLTSILEHTRRTSKVVPSAPVTIGNGSAAPTLFSPKKPAEYKSPFFALKEQDYDEPDLDSDVADETRSNLADYATSLYSSPQAAEKLLSKVPTTTARGYAYKITIPVTKSNADIQYDVPRRAAAVPDLGRVPGDAPPKPRRYISTEHLCAK